VTVHANIDDSAASTRAALKEAEQALRIALGSSRHQQLSDPACRLVAGDVASTLDAMARLLRSVGLAAVPTSPGTHDLHALIQHLNTGISMARSAAGTDVDRYDRGIVAITRGLTATPDD